MTISGDGGAYARRLKSFVRAVPERPSVARVLQSGEGAAGAFGVGRGDNFLLAALSLAVVTGLMILFRSHLDVLSVSLLYLMLVTGIALFAGRWVSIAMAGVAFLIFDLVFIEPYYTFTIADPDHVLALCAFLAVAALTSQLVGQLRQRTVEALDRGRQMETLFALSQALIADVTLESMLATIVNRVIEVLRVGSCSIMMPGESGRLTARAGRGPVPHDDDRKHAGMLDWVQQHGRPAVLGPPAGRLHPAPRRATRTQVAMYVPIATGGVVTGVMYVADPPGGRRFSDDDQQLLATFSNYAALALERIRLTDEATRAAVLARSDELKSALLSAVSHDLRTPLASIKASATSLLQPGIEWSPVDERDLLQAIDEETDRLARIVSNLLDLSRIEAGRLKPAVDWNDVEELLRETVARLEPALVGHPVALAIEPNLPPLLFDYVEIAQVVVNLLENAAKYSPADAAIDVAAIRDGACVAVSVADRGSGVPVGEEDRIFDKFQRLQMHRTIAGAGIGLSICKGIVEAHGGNIGVEPREGGGAVFHFTLPLAGPSGVDAP